MLAHVITVIATVVASGFPLSYAGMPEEANYLTFDQIHQLHRAYLKSKQPLQQSTGRQMPCKLLHLADLSGGTLSVGGLECPVLWLRWLVLSILL